MVMSHNSKDQNIVFVGSCVNSLRQFPGWEMKMAFYNSTSIIISDQLSLV